MNNFLLETTTETAAETQPGLWSQVVAAVVNWATTVGIRILIALLILFVGFKLINFLSRRIEKSCLKRGADKTIVNTLVYVSRIVLKVVVAVAVLGYLGVETSSFAAILASLSVCVGLAVNGALSNLAGGVLIILTRPFKIDDYIEAQGYSGTVENIHMVYTRLRTPDNKVVYVPNGPLSTGAIVNYSAMDLRRVDLTFSIGYGADAEQAKAIISKICNDHRNVLTDPAPFVRVVELAESSVNIVTRVWCKKEDYWDIYFDLNEKVKAALDAAGIEIPFNQLDVHIRQD